MKEFLEFEPEKYPLYLRYYDGQLSVIENMDDLNKVKFEVAVCDAISPVNYGYNESLGG